MSERPPRPPAGRAGLLPGALSVAAATGTTAGAAAAASGASRPHQTTPTPVEPAPTPPVPSLRTVPPTVQRPLVRILPRPGPAGRGLPASPAAGRGRSDARSASQRQVARGAADRGGQGRAPSAGHPEEPGHVETGKRPYNNFNQQCAMCNLPEARSDKRFKLCQDNRNCGRWVHKSRDRACFSVFNLSAPVDARCCKHHKGLKSACGCNSCNASRRKLVQAGSRGGGGGGRGRVGRGSGQGRGHGGRSGQGRGRGIGGPPPPPRGKVYQLPWRTGDESTTVAVRAGNAGVYVATCVNRQRRTSSCSRTECQGATAGFVSQQQTVGSHGGVASAVGGLCQHAALALEHMAANTMKRATSVLGGVSSRDYAAAKELVTAAKLGSHLTAEECNDVMSIVEGAERSGVWPVVETERHQYMVLDMRSRTTELDWGSVKFDQVSEGEASRRMTSSRHFMCKAVKGEACTENKNKKRARCAHTLVVAVFSRIGLDSTASSTGEGGAAAGASSGGSALPRTPQVFLDSDAESYCSKLADMLTYMRRLALPPTAPSGLARLSETPARRLVVSQTKCTCGGELLPEADVNATLVTEAPRIVSVQVERRKCGACGACAWASDNWRKTSVFNYNNYFLVELSLLYKCLGQFIRGTTIQSFFFSHLEPLTTNIGWLSENPDLAASITDKDSRFFVTLTNVFLGFLAVIDFSFEFRCFQWGSHSEVFTVDACVKMSVNTLTKALANKTRPETTLDFDMSMLCLKLSLVSAVFFTERVQFVLGDLEAVGRTPAWVSPDNRRAERGIKTDRAVVPKSVYTFVPPNRADLLGALEEKGGGISLVDEMPAEDLKKLHKVVFGTLSPSGLPRKEDYIAKFRALFHDGDCSKQFLGGRGGVATAGMVCAFTPAGVMVAWKVLPTAESPNDVVDFMRWMKVKPYLLSYDAACKLVKGLEKYCPGLLKDKTGVLQRDGEGNVVFPELAHVGNNRNSATRDTAARTFQDLPRTTDREDMYAVIETAGPRPGLQSEVDPDEALFWAAKFSKVVGGRSKLTATRALDALHRDGVRVLSLFEVLVFTYYWHRKAAGDAAGGAAGGAVGGAVGGAAGEAAGWVVHAPLGGDEGGGFTHTDAAGFLLRVLVGLSGSRQASKVSALPSWLHATCISEGELETGLRRYAKAKVDFVVDCLKPLTSEARERAAIAVRGGIGFGRGVYALKELELSLARNAAPHATTTEEGKVVGYDAIFHDTRYKNFEGDPIKREMRIGPDGHHENNHGPDCRKLYSGLTTCKDIGGVNLTRHESDHGVKAMYLRSINNMTFPNFTYSLSVINELQNRKYNRKRLGALLSRVVGHASTSLSGCQAALWTCGRCFCDKPLVRVFDCFGRLDLVFLSSVLAP